MAFLFAPRRNYSRYLLSLLLIFLLAGCGERVAPATVSTAAATVSLPTASPSPFPTEAITTPAATSISPTAAPSPTSTTAGADAIRELTILYTNDEHGWMEGMSPGQDAASLVGLWREIEGYAPGGPFLVLSGGDMWTGPAISTWFEGESMAEILNEMGYAAAAVGNHEFDFGLPVLQQRAAQSDFPFLSANIRYRDSGEVPIDLGIQPYTVVDANGIRVGIIGLTTVATPQTTNPVNVVDFEFIDYETALREMVPQVRADGAELILVPAHVCQAELEQLARQIADLGVHMLGGGHCNELFSQEINDIILLEGGYHLTSYAYATFTVDTASDTVVSTAHGTRPNEGGTADPVLAEMIAHWQTTTAAELDEVIGYTEAGISRRSPEMQRLITGAWLWSYPGADVAITNLGGLRAALPPGEITLADLIGVLPFNNVIVALELTGQELLQVLAHGNVAVAGVDWIGTGWVLEESGAAIDPEQSYLVLVNDFMYAGGDGYEFLATFDAEAYNTGIDWRQPVIDWIIAGESDITRPLEDLIDRRD